jgi:hypothetical protein
MPSRIVCKEVEGVRRQRDKSGAANLIDQEKAFGRAKGVLEKEGATKKEAAT